MYNGKSRLKLLILQVMKVLGNLFSLELSFIDDCTSGKTTYIEVTILADYFVLDFVRGIIIKNEEFTF